MTETSELVRVLRRHHKALIAGAYGKDPERYRSAYDQAADAIERLERELAEANMYCERFQAAGHRVETERDAALARAEKAERAQAWQPIETAPAGQQILLAWRASGWITSGEYDPAVGLGADDDGFYSHEPPTHWRPLPAPPSEAPGASEIFAVAPPNWPNAKEEPWTHCRAGIDGEKCQPGDPPGCPQLRDGEPARSGRHCPLDVRDDD